MKSEAAIRLAKAIEDGIYQCDNGALFSPEEKKRIGDRLVASGVRPDNARLYADAFVEHATMVKAIEREGAKPALTRRRDRAKAELIRMRWAQADWLWNGT